MGSTLANAALVTLFGFVANPPAPGGEGPSPAILDGLWRATFSGAARDLDGDKISVRLSTFLQFTDLDGPAVSLAPFSGECTLVPATSGVRLPGSFFVEGPGVSMAAAVKVDAATGQGISFSGVLNLDAGDRIASLKVRAKRVGAPGPSVPVFEEDFEGGLGAYVETDALGNPAATLWHAEGFCAAGTPIPAAMGSGAAAYNRGDETPPVYTYSTGSANEGALVGPLLTVPKKALGVTAEFEMLRVTENMAGFDESFFEIQCFGDVSWTTVAPIMTEGIGCGGTPVVVTIGPTDPVLNMVLRRTFAHRFRFDTFDAGANGFLGWYVDDVSIGVVKSASAP